MSPVVNLSGLTFGPQWRGRPVTGRHTALLAPSTIPTTVRTPRRRAFVASSSTSTVPMPRTWSSSSTAVVDVM
jgi:hypothetical protein